jgi:hypothetical protein
MRPVASEVLHPFAMAFAGLAVISASLYQQDVSRMAFLPLCVLTRPIRPSRFRCESPPKGGRAASARPGSQCVARAGSFPVR